MSNVSPRQRHIANIQEWARMHPESREVATRAKYLIDEANEQADGPGFAAWLLAQRPHWVGVATTSDAIELAAKGEVPKTES